MTAQPEIVARLAFFMVGHPNLEQQCADDSGVLPSFYLFVSIIISVVFFLLLVILKDKEKKKRS